MTVENLQRIFKPRSVAVIGASAQPHSVGHTVLKNLIEAKFPGPIYGVNPKYNELLGAPVVPRVEALPQVVDLAVVCTPAPTVSGIVRACGAAGTRGLVILSAGFREAGQAGRDLERDVLAAAREFPGLRLIGPNCLGVIVPGIGLNASFAAAMPPAGSVAFVSQSGALCTAVLDWAIRERIGFSHFVSVGNMLDVGLGDLIDYFAADPHTSALLLYVESLSDARGFMSAARAFSRVKPIIAYKAGRFTESAQAAASHTGALAGVDAVYQAAFQRAGIVRVFDMESLFDCAELLGRKWKVRGDRLAIVTNAGGPGVMATDALIERRGRLAQLSPATLELLNKQLPPSWSHGNPIDVLGDAPPERFARALGTVLADEAVDAAVVLLTPQAMTDPTATAEAISQLEFQDSKPLLAGWMGGDSVAEGIARLNARGIPTYASGEQAVRAFSHLVDYHRNLELLYETPRSVPLSFEPDRAASRRHLEAVAQSGRELFTEDESKRLLADYGIPVTTSHPASTAAEAVDLARQIGYPVVLKLWSKTITHKTDVGGVVLNLKNDAEVAQAFERIISAARAARPEAAIEGVTVQRMVAMVHGVELILGARRDPVFGSVIMLGMGGIATEIFQDRSLELPPLNERLARRMMESLRAWKLLQGYRGRPAVNHERLIEILMRFSYLVADLPELRELDVNPLVASPSEVIALDARVIIDRAPSEATGSLPAPRPYSHLAIHPYPREFVTNGKAKDGQELLLRPIAPEDEPLWLALLASCSAQTLWFRFRYLFKAATHEMASRYCYIDYDREMAIVAQAIENGENTLTGVGRLVVDDDRRSAEFAVLVADRWQGRGVGKLLLDACLDVAQRWGLARVVGETTPDNQRMIRLFQSRGFALDYGVDPDIVVARRAMDS